MKITEIDSFIANYKTKWPEGFVYEEIQAVASKFPDMDRKRFDEALMGVTGMMKGSDMITYHSDIFSAVVCGLERRGLTTWEFD